MKTFLTVAGSDPSGGAGIQADIKTAAAFGVYSMSVPTALTIQNTLGVSGVFEVPAETVKAQISAVTEDIFPDAVKIGMCVNMGITRAIIDCLEDCGAKNIVLDPVLVSTSGKRLLSEDALRIMKSELFKLVDILTPNVPEAEIITGITIKNEDDMIRAAESIKTLYGCDVLLKGGHMNGCDIFYDGGVMRLEHELLDNPNTHGTGCTLSSAVACGLALGKSRTQAVRNAVEYVVGAIRDGMKLGHGTGPLNHMFSGSP